MVYRNFPVGTTHVTCPAVEVCVKTAAIIRVSLLLSLIQNNPI